MKKWICLFTVLALLAALTVPALALDYGIIYDGTNLLDSEEFQSLVGAVSDRCAETEFDMHVDIVTDTEGYPLEEYAEAFYETYAYGWGDTADGSVLMLQLRDDGGDLGFEDYALYFGGVGKELFTDELRGMLRQALDTTLNAEAWSGDLDSDRNVCMTAIATYASMAGSVVEQYRSAQRGGDESADAAAPAADNAPGLGYVTDLAGLLTQEQYAELTARAESISQRYGCGVYIVTVENFREYEGSDLGIYSFATYSFNQYNLGMGEDKNGVMLVLSMSERDFTLIAHGDIGNAAFTDYGKEVMADDGFLPYFAKNNWYGGFSSYLDYCERFLAMRQQDTPFDIDTDPNYGMSTGAKVGIVVIIPAIIAGIACMIMKGKMKSVAERTDANEYIAQHGVELTRTADIYTHTTQTRVRIEQPRSSSGHGGTSVGSGGFSGHSGKF